MIDQSYALTIVVISMIINQGKLLNKSHTVVITIFFKFKNWLKNAQNY